MKLSANDDRPFYLIVGAWALIIGLTGTLIASPFLLTLAGYTSVLALLALSINVMLGGVGEVPLGQGLFYGVGAYGIGIGMKRYGLSYEAAVVVGVMAAIPLSALIGALTLRLTGALNRPGF